MDTVTDQDDLTLTERDLVNHCAAGTLCDVSDRSDEQTLRAWVIYELCVGTRWPVHAKGVMLRGAVLEDPLDFEHATLLVSLTLLNCIMEDVTLARATGRTIRFTDCTIRGQLHADLMHVDRFSLDGSTVKALRMMNATIDETLDLRDTRLEGIDMFTGYSLNANGS